MGRPEFRFKLNGGVITEVCVRRETVSGKLTDKLEIAVKDEILGWFAIDDNSSLWDDALPKFLLQYRNETEWQMTSLSERRLNKDKGWKTVTPDELLMILKESGVIK